MKRTGFLLRVPTLLISCIALSSSSTRTSLSKPAPETQNALPGPTDPTQLIILKAVETFDIVLRSNSSTGYRWKLVGELDENIVQPVWQD